jgi:hypothetical protein
VDFQFANVSPHGIYMEDLLILDPDADAYQIRLVTFTLHDPAALDKSSPGPSMSFEESTPGNAGGSAGSSARGLPMLIKRGESPTLSLLIARDAKLWFDNGQIGIARAKVSFLGEENPQSVAWRFLIRNK